MSKKIETLLRKALLQGGEMAQGLYKYELEENIDYWYKGLKADRFKESKLSKNPRPAENGHSLIPSAIAPQ